MDSLKNPTFRRGIYEKPTYKGKLPGKEGAWTTGLFLYALKISKTSGFLKFLGGIERVYSSIVDKVIGVILDLFIIFFTRKCYKHKKSEEAYKQTKLKKAAFLCA